MRFTGVAMVAASVWLAGAGLAAAQNPVVFPSSLDREPLLSWLRRETDIGFDRVVAVTPQALTSIVSTFPAGPGAEKSRLTASSPAGGSAMSFIAA